MITVPPLPIYKINATEDPPLDWDELYVDLAPRIYNYFRYRLGQEGDAEDLTSRTFEKAWVARHQYRRDLAGFSTWIFKIAQNVVIDHFRSQRVHLPIDHANEAIVDDGVEANPERLSDLSRLAFLTRRLMPREQDLIALKYGADLSNRDIAKLTGLSETNVGSTIHRIVKSLRQQW
jgi:RNA polymerase sigma-70 factor, ECF subfamily